MILWEPWIKVIDLMKLDVIDEYITCMFCFASIFGMRIKSYVMNFIEKDALCRLQADDGRHRHDGRHGFEGDDGRHAGDR